MDELLAVLKSDLVEQDISSDWQITINDTTINVTASTSAMTTDPAAAWKLSESLRDAILKTGYELHYGCQVGISAEKLEEEGPHEWRGFVQLTLKPVER